MIELIEVLNKTGGDRTFFYGVVFVATIAIIVNGIAQSIKYLTKKPKSARIKKIVLKRTANRPKK